MTVNKQYRLNYSEKAAQLVSQMSLEEKVYLMSGRVPSIQMFDRGTEFGTRYNEVPYSAGGNERLGVPEMKFVDGPRGVVSGNGTCFPVSMSRGATFDRELERRIGRVIGSEIRAHGGNLFGGVCINLPYNPGWGRSQEVYGEDSYLLGQMGAALTEGVQEQNVIACVKHYAFNSMEDARFTVNVIADKRTEREVYLQHFKDCIDAGAAGIMTSYNLYQGTHAGHSDYLLNKVLKDEWDFDGFVISDFVWGVKDTVEAANGGMDIEMCHTKYFGDNLVKAVRDGNIPEEKVDQSATRIVRTLLAFTEADEKEYKKDIIGSTEHVSLALEAARKSMTLIQNDDNVLPLSKKHTKRIAVIGELAVQDNLGDHGSSRVYPKYTVSPLEGLEKLLPNVEIIYEDGKDIEKAKTAAVLAEAVIFVVGYDHDDEGERIQNDNDSDSRTAEQLESRGFAVGGDRKDSLGLHQHEINLLQSVGPHNENSVAVLIGGNMIMIDEWKDSVSSIIMAYYPGMEGGTAIAETLFGEVNPSGKLPFVIPTKEEYLPQVDWNATEITYDYYHGYTKLEKSGIKPYVPFGFGMSYTNFTISNTSFNVRNNEIIAACEVENTGNCTGAEVIQMYIGFSNSEIDRPIKVLRGFDRVELEAGEKRTIEIACPIDRVKWFNSEINAWELEEMDYEVYIGTSSAEEDLIQGKVFIGE